MALDTAAKRGSSIHVGCPWRSILPFPDATIDQGDRQATAYDYSGIAASGGAVAAVHDWITIARRRGVR